MWKLWVQYQKHTIITFLKIDFLAVTEFFSIIRIELFAKKYRKAEYVQRRVRFVNVQSFLHENVVFSVYARMCNAAYGIFIM